MKSKFKVRYLWFIFAICCAIFIASIEIFRWNDDYPDDLWVWTMYISAMLGIADFIISVCFTIKYWLSKRESKSKLNKLSGLMITSIVMTVVFLAVLLGGYIDMVTDNSEFLGGLRGFLTMTFISPLFGVLALVGYMISFVKYKRRKKRLKIEAMQSQSSQLD